MPSELPILPVRFATEAEKLLMREVAELAGAPNFNAWAITLLRETGEAVLRSKAPQRLDEFFKARQKVASKKKPRGPRKK